MQFRVLGPLEVDAGDGPIPLGGPKQRSLLANLLVRANQVVPAETLIDEVWGEEPPEQARNTLQTHVSHIRKAIGTERIEGRSPGYVLIVGPDELDLTRFESLVRDAQRAMPVDPNLAVVQLDAALALWRGPALADVAGQPSLYPEAARLDELRLDALQARIEGLLAAGAHGSAIGEVEALVARHPLREGLWGLLMVALYREGRQADALNAYQRAREILAEELGIDPSPELAGLHERVLRQDPTLELRGEPLRGYRLLEKIGEGSAGVVFRATQPHVGRDVAVKVFHRAIAEDPDFARRFEREAQAVAALEHPHVVPIHDYWREPGGGYMVARYLRGGSARALKDRGGSLEPDHAARIVEQVSSALAFAHQQGVAHGSVHTSNVLLDAEGNAYLGDFRVGIGARPDPADDVRDLAALARVLLGRDVPVELVDGAGDGTRATPAARDLRNPYKGLRAFTEPDAPDFFGRTVLTRGLVARLGEQGPGSRFLAVVGPSGCGKSSVVHAGLVPAIRHGAWGDPDAWFVADMFPGAHPIDGLEAALQRVALRPAHRLHDLLEGSSRGLLEAVDLIVPPQTEVLLVVDQFEEAFTLAGDDAERELFLESLRVATADPESRLRVVATLRADFYDRPLAAPRFGELLAARSEAVPPLTPDELEQAIRLPAEHLGVRPEPGLVAEMIADIAHQPGALPLLEYALTELFEGRDDSRMTLDAYRELGGAAGALSARADRLYEGADPHGRRAIRQVFLRLVTLGEGRQDTRRRVARSELVGLEVEPAAIDTVLDAYGRHRVLTFDREPVTRESTVEIAHEALLGTWGRLRGWINEAREDLRQDRRLARAASEWRAADRDSSFLLRGTRLDQVEVWSGATSLAIGGPERAYIEASVEEQHRERADEERRRVRELQIERRSMRRLRGLVAVFAVAAVVAASLTIVASKQRERAREAAGAARDAETAQLAQRLGAQALVEEDLDLSLLLARQAVAIDDSPQIRGYLLAALQGSPDAIGIMHPSGLLASSAISPDGGTLAVTGYGDGTSDGLFLFDTGTFQGISHPLRRLRPASVAYNRDETLAVGGGGWVRLIDPGTGRELAVANVIGTASRMEFTSDGSRLVVLATPDGGDARITVRDAATLRPTGPAIEPEAFEGAYVGFEFASPHFGLRPDDRSLVTASEDGELRVWDLRSAETTRTFQIPAGLHALALSPDGNTAAVGIAAGIELIDLSSGDRVKARGSLGGSPNWLLFAPNGDTVVSTNFDGTVTLWDARQATPRETLRGHANTVGQPVFDPEGNTLYTVSHDGTAIAWDMTGKRGFGQRFRFTRDRLLPRRWSWGAHPGQFSPDGRLVAVGLQGEGIKLLDGKELKRVGTLPGTGGEVREIAFSPDGQTLAAAALRGVVTLWDISTRSRVSRRTVQNGNPWPELAFSPDGSTLAMSARSGVRLFNATSGASIGKVGAGEVGDIAFSGDGTKIATARGSEGGADVWDLATGAPIFRLDATSDSDPLDATVALSPDGRTLAVGGWHPTVRLADVHTGKVLHELDLAAAGAFNLEFSPDGRTLAVSGWEAVASLWDVASGTQIGRRFEAGSRRMQLDLSADGRLLLMTAADGHGAVWDIDPESWAREACKLANRTLTPDEWAELLPGKPYAPAC